MSVSPDVQDLFVAFGVGFGVAVGLVGATVLRRRTY